ncbi:MAG: hypothetical protein ACXVIG_02130 [Halobacteriota archaeon]
MQVDVLTILLFLLAIFYLVMLPGYLVILALRLHELDVIETLTASFGIGVSVLAALSIALSLTGSIGLTFPSLIIANTTFLVVVGSIMYVKNRSKRRADYQQGKAPHA